MRVCGGFLRFSSRGGLYDVELYQLSSQTIRDIYVVARVSGLEAGDDTLFYFDFHIVFTPS